MLDQVPPEVLSLIALHLAIPTCAPPIALLTTCKSIHTTLSSSSNPRLYARIFRARFDTKAVERRRGDLSTSDLLSELKRRVGALERLARAMTAGAVEDVRSDDLWVVYVMLIENDGKNLEHLLSRDGPFHLPTFLQRYHEKNLLAAALEAGYPAETVSRALTLWIAWLLSGFGPAQSERPEDRDERLFVLRPYVFAAQQYNMYFAPWTLHGLPLAAYPDVEVEVTGDGPDPNPFIADLMPRPREVRIEWYGQITPVCPPMLSHAAILRFFTKKSPAELVQDLGISPSAPFTAMGHLGIHGVDDDAQAFQIDTVSDYETLRSAGTVTDDFGDDHEESSDLALNSVVLVADSRLHDRDFDRLRQCYDPSVSRGLPCATWRGCWDGCWEGTFSFFDFEAFREMLVGQSRALYEGPFGEQAQVWKLEETYIRRKPLASAQRHTSAHDGVNRSLPLNGPVTNAGFPTDQSPSTSAGLGTPSAEAITLRETIRQQVEAIEGYEQVPEDELDEAFGADEGRGSGLEILLTGTGHSAWGRFILRGRVRTWDGMASLVKEYAVSVCSPSLASRALGVCFFRYFACFILIWPRGSTRPIHIHA